jgi:hypothetical protein
VPPLPASRPRLLTGVRVRRLRAAHSYGFVLALVVASFAFAALAPDESWAAAVLVLLYATTLATALWTSGVIGLRSRRAAALVALGLAAGVLELVFDAPRLSGVVALLAGVLIAVTIVVIAAGVIEQGEVNAQSVRGAISIYVLIGLLFASVYGALAVLGSGDFFAQGTDGTRAVRVYFSFVTLATMGYGDYTAAGELGRALAVLQGLTGQLYLVTVVALIVSQIGLGARRFGGSSRADDEHRDDRT